MVDQRPKFKSQSHIKNIRQKLHHFRFGKVFLAMTQKSQKKKQEKDKSEFFKIQNFGIKINY